MKVKGMIESDVDTFKVGDVIEVKLADGVIVNRHSYRCQMEGCQGWRICVKWPDGHHTYPCSCGYRSIDKNTLQIV